MDEFMEACAEVYPEMVVQFEDFESEKAFKYLDRYRNKYRCFNDDIQGTGAVVLAGYVLFYPAVAPPGSADLHGSWRHVT